ncbi:hypothetical protein AG1IA_05365 [Rhizoctonia solani AG-1 IA]|uniref:Caspase domain-containing protein n=1 Tax=Thanatephorus cucumeris (strain AG1-IA) TaxID=983506 RepID=L8WW78_THACA|nr:hypothetical protein AG1IA_05365 [Rhizoctonia solani AG-1 IA]
MQACILPLQTQFGLFTIALLDLLSSRQPVLAGTTCPSAREFIDVDQHIETGAPPSEEAIADEIRQSYEHILFYCTPLFTIYAELGTIPGSKRGSTGPVHQSSLFNSDWLDLFQTGLNHSASCLVDRFIVLIRYPSIAWFGSGPLLGTLYGQTPTLSIFAISSTDFEDDVKVLADTLMPLYPQNFQLTKLDVNTAFTRIKHEIKKLCSGHQGAPDRHLLIYVTSHGDTNNDMFISESKRLKESDLFGLFSQLAIVATILVDICREGNTPSISPPEGISVIRSCSLAQKAGTFRIKGLAAPGSCFLNAVMIAACTPNLQHDDDGYRIRLSVQERLDQLIKYLNYRYSERHGKEAKCTRCPSYTDRCPEPTKQTIDWGDARVSLPVIITIPHAVNTYNGIPYPVATEADTAPNLAFQPVHRPPGHAGQLERGAMSPLAGILFSELHPDGFCGSWDLGVTLPVLLLGILRLG